MGKILVVEDEETLLSDIAIWLKYEDFDVLTANNGQDGLDLVHTHQPDLIICDIQMPKMNGFELLTEVRSLPYSRDVPFLFLTAQTDIESMRKGMHLGADDYIAKPFEYDNLLNAIQVRLKKHQDAETIIFSKVSHLMIKQIDNIKQELARSIDKEITFALRSLQMYTTDIDEALTEANKFQDLTTHLNNITNMSEYMSARLVPNVVINLGANAMIQWLALHYRRSFGLQINFDFQNNYISHSEEILKHLFYILDELLNNIAQHAQTKEVHIHIQQANDTIYCSVSDKGVGFDSDNFWENITTLGLMIARERSRLCGGELEILSDKDVGTTVNFSIETNGEIAHNSPAIQRFHLPTTEITNPSQKHISIVIAHTDSLSLRGLNQVIAVDNNIRNKASCESTGALFNLIEDGLRFDILLINGGLAQTLKDEQIQTLIDHEIRVIVIGELNANLPALLHESARGFITEEEVVDHLSKIIQAIYDGKTYRLPSQFIDHRDTSPLNILTQRELEVLEMVANNHQNAEIAQKMVISIRTVETHRANMMRKLDLRNKSELLLFALKHGVISIDE